MLTLSITLSEEGDLALIVPSGRKIAIAPTEAGARFLLKILRDANAGIKHQRGYIGAFPTQSVTDAWLAAERQRQRAAIEAAAVSNAAKAGIDLAELTFEL